MGSRIAIGLWVLLALGVLTVALVRPGSPSDTEAFVILMMFILAFPISFPVVYGIGAYQKFLEQKLGGSASATSIRTVAIWACFVLAAYIQMRIISWLWRRVKRYDK